MVKSQKAIYLDYHATTPVDDKVLEAMLPYFTEHFGNPASRSHAYGWQASEAVELARGQIADLLHVEAGEIIFTSGSTESLNMAIKGMAETMSHTGKHIITITTEHQAVLDPVIVLKRKGFEVSWIPVTSDGMIDIEEFKNAFRNDTIMVIVMWANNETGVVQDMKTIGSICRERGVILISDATQAAGKININPVETGVDILSLSSHKIYGPKGVGALYISKNVKSKPAALIQGGGHEKGFRSGTLNVPGIVGFGKTAQLRKNDMNVDDERILQLRNHFEHGVLASLEEITVNGNMNSRLSTVSNLKVKGVDSQAVMTRFRTKLAISSGSACSSANPEPSHVLLAMGLTPTEAKGSFRISFGVPTTMEEVDHAAAIFIEAIQQERSQSPVWQMFKQGTDIG